MEVPMKIWKNCDEMFQRNLEEIKKKINNVEKI